MFWLELKIFKKKSQKVDVAVNSQSGLDVLEKESRALKLKWRILPTGLRIQLRRAEDGTGQVKGRAEAKSHQRHFSKLRR